MQSFFMWTTKTDQTVRMNKTDMNLRWAHMSEGTFSHAAAHMFSRKNKKSMKLFLAEKKKKKKKTLSRTIIAPDTNSFPVSGNFCRLLITFANSLDPDQARQNVGPDLDPNCLTL